MRRWWIMEGGRPILLLDDDPSLIHYAEKYLARLGFSVLLARTSEEAERTLASSDAAVCLAIVDVTAAGGLASNFGRRLQERSPGTPILYWSGYLIPEEQLREGHSGPVGFLTKPFRPRQLTEMIEQLVTRP